jgi:hypothetical protein
MSDDTTQPLRDVDPEDYYLAIKSLEPDVIALAPSRDARYPRVIAVGSGQGQLLRVSLELIDECMQTKSSNVALAVQLAEVDVQLRNKKDSDDQTASNNNNVWPPMTEKTNADDVAIGNILSNIALRDDHSYYNGKKAAMRTSSTSHHGRLDDGEEHRRYFMDAHLSPLEIGMYILLAVFCAAMAVFMASCFVYASKFKRQEYPLHKSLSASLSQHPQHPPEQTASTTSSSKTSAKNAHDWVWLGKTTIEKVSDSSSRQTLEQESAASRRSMTNQRLSYVGSEINIIPNPQTEEFEPKPVSSSSMMEASEKIPLVNLRPSPFEYHNQYRVQPRHSPYPRQQFNYDGNGVGPASIRGRLPPTYENLSPRRSRNRRMHLPMTPGSCTSTTTTTRNEKNKVSPEIINNPMFHSSSPDPDPAPTGSQRRRRLLPKVDSATYTKKVAALAGKSSPPAILPVGYPIFAPSPKSAADLSPLDLLPDPSSFDNENCAVGPPLRQSPASALPPMLDSAAEQQIKSSKIIEVTVVKEELKEAAAASMNKEEQERGEYEPLNPDIDRPSPPRTGASRLFENPFEISDEDSAPVEPEKLSPSHVFESTSLEATLLQLDDQAAAAAGLDDHQRPLSKLDSRTFVIKRPSASSSASSSRKSTPSASAASTPSTVNAGDLTELDSFELGEEASINIDEEPQDDDVAMDMDYDNLMAYFESLKESTA